MGKSFRNKSFYEDYEDMMYDGRISTGKPRKSFKDDKKLEIQRARRKSRAERDMAILKLEEGEDSDI